ncbi:hypothetical protein [Enterocloster sp.]
MDQNIYQAVKGISTADIESPQGRDYYGGCVDGHGEMNL